MTLQLELTPTDQDLIRTFRTLTRLDNKTTFSSDDFRMYGLDRFITDKQHGIGTFFAKLKHYSLIRETGRKRSTYPPNHMREIRTYEWVLRP